MGKIVGLVVKENKPQFVCPECGKEYKTEDGLNNHMKKEHSKENAPE